MHNFSTFIGIKFEATCQLNILLLVFMLLILAFDKCSMGMSGVTSLGGSLKDCNLQYSALMCAFVHVCTQSLFKTLFFFLKLIFIS